MPHRHPRIARALGLVRRIVASAASAHGRRVLVAWSGGPDSAALLGLLELLARDLRLELAVAHVDHGLRPESRREAEMVAEAAAARGHPVFLARLRLTGGPGLPARAREARRAALTRLARRSRSSVIALGHTATDQAETVLLHLARGAGLEGLAAMAPYEPWPEEEKPASGRQSSSRGERRAPRLACMRPLLGLGREETRELADRLGIVFVDDPTNIDERHPRVAVRKRVLPVLQSIHRDADLACARAASLVRDTAEALDAWAEAELTARARGGGRWSVAGLQDLPRALRTRAIRAACLGAGVDSDALPHRVVVAIDDAIGQGGRVRTWDLHPGRRVLLHRDLLTIETVPRRGPPTRKASRKASRKAPRPHRRKGTRCRETRRTLNH